MSPPNQLRKRLPKWSLCWAILLSTGILWVYDLYIEVKPMSDKFQTGNQNLWDEWTDIHIHSDYYDLRSFKAGRCSLRSIEIEELGDVTSKSLLHLQCHFGLDTLSWARRGAEVTGADFSDRAISFARQLSNEMAIPANFVHSDVIELPSLLDDEFDIVFTSYGVLAWLPDLTRWAEVIAHFLKPGGIFYIVEFHPFFCVFDDSDDIEDLRVAYPYFEAKKPLEVPVRGSYADRDARLDLPLMFSAKAVKQP
jgi:SAM-dependent methyltransferase